MLIMSFLFVIVSLIATITFIIIDNIEYQKKMQKGLGIKKPKYKLRRDRMPIPSPSKGETREKFMTRCMSNDVMMHEFKDKKQRLAVCFQKYRDKNKKKSELSDNEVEKLIEAFLQRHPELVAEE